MRCDVRDNRLLKNGSRCINPLELIIISYIFFYFVSKDSHGGKFSRRRGKVVLRSRVRRRANDALAAWCNMCECVCVCEAE